MTNSKTLYILIGIIVGLGIMAVYSTTQENNSTIGWTLVFQHDKEGTPVAGSKEKLLSAIRNGYSIRVGWGWKGEQRSIEHLSEPIWLAILSEAEVMAHLDPQILSGIDWDIPTANYADTTLLKQEWRVVLTTEGKFDAVWTDKFTGEIIRRVPQNHPMSWFAEIPTSDKEGKPLFLTE